MSFSLGIPALMMGSRKFPCPLAPSGLPILSLANRKFGAGEARVDGYTAHFIHFFWMSFLQM